MEHRAFMINMIQSELEDAVGVENVSVRPTDQLVYGVDYFWVARMWADKAQVYALLADGKLLSTGTEEVFRNYIEKLSKIEE